MPLVRNPPDKRLAVGEPHAIDLRSPSADARWQTARAAEDDPKAVPALAEALGRETNSRVREAIFTALLRIGSPECVDVVLPYLRSDDAALRTSAIDVLRGIPKSVERRLGSLFADADSDVRLLSCELARGLESTLTRRGFSCRCSRRKRRRTSARRRSRWCRKLGTLQRFRILRGSAPDFRTIRS